MRKLLLARLSTLGSNAMPVIKFGGKVLPEVIKITITDHPAINWLGSEYGLEISFKISIHEGVVVVECTLNQYNHDTDLVRVYMRAFDLVRATVDLTCFSTGYGLSVILDTFTNPEGITTPFVPHNPQLAALCTAFDMGTAKSIEQNVFHEVLTIVLSDWRIFRILRQLIEANTVPHESSVNCARVIEGIRHLLASPGASTKQSWEDMRKRLNLSVDYLKLITDVSTGPRHGDSKHIPGTTTVEITRRAWAVMNRFLEYKKRHDQPLPITEFPLL
jgi:hypothetical protein